MKQPTHFIEVIKDDVGTVRQISPAKIELLFWALTQSVKFNVETIAVFKIYRKPKPAIAHYDNTVNAIIVE